LTSTGFVSLVDHGIGNTGNVRNALGFLGFQVRNICSSSDFESPGVVVLPGVGNFEAVMSALRVKELIQPLREYLEQDKPFVGICVGMQVLMRTSSESPREEGFGVFDGHMLHLNELSKSAKVPSIGWKDLNYSARWDGPQLEKAYFVHSYFVSQVGDEDVVSSYDWHGEQIPAHVSAGRIHGFQFHPEKSRATGLLFLGQILEELGNSN
jgi:glutamine amidotransferase/cyclase